MKWLVAISLFLISCTASQKVVQVKLDGSKSYDPDGHIVKYEWRQIEGKQGSIANPNKVTTTAKVTGKSRTAWELTVTDNEGAQDKDTTRIK